MLIQVFTSTGTPLHLAHLRKQPKKQRAGTLGWYTFSKAAKILWIWQTSKQAKKKDVGLVWQPLSVYQVISDFVYLSGTNLGLLAYFGLARVSKRQFLKELAHLKSKHQTLCFRSPGADRQYCPPPNFTHTTFFQC